MLSASASPPCPPMNALDSLRQLTERPRLWRAVLVAAFLVPVLLVLPHARSLVVRNAVVTAYLSDFRSPIDGRVEAIPVAPGERPEAGQSVLSIHNPRVDRSRLARLEVLSAAADEEVGFLQASLEALRALAGERAGQTRGYGEAIERDLRARQQQLTDEQQARDAALVAAEAGLERVRNLHREGLASPSDLEEAEAFYEAARSSREANREALSRLQAQWAELPQGVYQGGEQDGALFTRQMEQELTLRLLEEERALRVARTEQRAKRAELDRARTALERSAEADIVLPEGKSVFDIYTSVGAWVTAGSRVASAVDCAGLMVDIAVDDALLQLIEPDQEVSVRVFGSLQQWPARVVLVRGSAALGDEPVLAASVPQRGNRKGRVLARIEGGDMPQLTGQTCGIGRTAYAEFEDIGLFTLMFYPLFR